jgi:glutaredoxin
MLYFLNGGNMEATVFSTPKCTWCDKVTRMLTDVEIEVNKIDITESRENYDLMMDMTGNVKTVPQVVVDGNLIGGYTETERFLNNL